MQCMLVTGGNFISIIKILTRVDGMGADPPNIPFKGGKIPILWYYTSFWRSGLNKKLSILQIFLHPFLK